MKMKSISFVLAISFASVGFAASSNSCPALDGNFGNCQTVSPANSSATFYSGDIAIRQVFVDGVTQHQFSRIIAGQRVVETIPADGVVRSFLLDGGAAIGVWLQRKHECTGGKLVETIYYPFSNNPNLIQSVQEISYDLTANGDLEITSINPDVTSPIVAVCQRK